MLKITLHAGSLATRNPGNQLMVLDIAYAKQDALSDYLVAMTLKGVGEVAPDFVRNYPRWSSSLWDLTARALTRVLYRADQAPKSAEPDRRCAYATRLCAVIERSTVAEQGVALGFAEILQDGSKRGVYTVRLDEDILGQREGRFAYGLKALNPADLFLRAICAGLYDSDVLGPRPKLILPPTMPRDGVDHFHIEALDEPAKTGFQRYRAVYPSTSEPDPFPAAEDYVRFLQRG
jgi:hypothetical protein